MRTMNQKQQQSIGRGSYVLAVYRREVSHANCKSDLDTRYAA